MSVPLRSKPMTPLHVRQKEVDYGEDRIQSIPRTVNLLDDA